jgi:Tfp pilus assembly protein PilV
MHTRTHAPRRGTTLTEVLVALALLTSALLASAILLTRVAGIIRASDLSARAAGTMGSRLERLRVNGCNVTTAGSERNGEMSESWSWTRNLTTAQGSDSIVHSSPSGDVHLSLRVSVVCR